MLPQSKSLKITFDNLGSGWQDFSLSNDDHTYLFELSYLGEGMPEIISATLDFFATQQDQAIFLDLEGSGTYTLRLLWAGNLLRLRVDTTKSKERKHWTSERGIFDFTIQPSLFVKALNKAASDVIGMHGYKGFNEDWTPGWRPESKITSGLLRKLDELALSLPSLP